MKIYMNFQLLNIIIWKFIIIHNYSSIHYCCDWILTEMPWKCKWRSFPVMKSFYIHRRKRRRVDLRVRIITNLAWHDPGHPYILRTLNDNGLKSCQRISSMKFFTTFPPPLSSPPPGENIFIGVYGSDVIIIKGLWVWLSRAFQP